MITQPPMYEQYKCETIEERDKAVETLMAKYGYCSVREHRIKIGEREPVSVWIVKAKIPRFKR